MSKQQPVHAMASAPRRSGSSAWATSAASASGAERIPDRIATLCGQVQHATVDLLLNRGDEANYGLMALWPPTATGMERPARIAHRTLVELAEVVQSAASEGPPLQSSEIAHLAHPIEVDGRLRRAVALELATRSQRDLAQSLQRVHWRSGWLTVKLAHWDNNGQHAPLAQMAGVQCLAAEVLDQGAFPPFRIGAG